MESYNQECYGNLVGVGGSTRILFGEGVIGSVDTCKELYNTVVHFSTEVLNPWTWVCTNH